MLTDDEIRLKIAELKGWKYQEQAPDGYNPAIKGWLKAPDGNEYFSGQWFTLFPDIVKNWPGDIAAAWGLAQEALDGGCQVSVNSPNWNDRGEPIPGWWVRMEIPLSDDSFYNIAHDGNSDTAARAICLAWLKWKGVEV